MTRSYNFVVVDLVRNPEGELLAVSRNRGGWLEYHRTARDGAEIAEERSDYYFKRKSDIKKVRSSKEKDRMIDRLNLWILQENIGFMAVALEKANDQLYSYAEKAGINTYGERWHENLPQSHADIAEAVKWLNRGSNAYSNFLDLTFEKGNGAYNIQIERQPVRWSVIEEHRGKNPTDL